MSVLRYKDEDGQWHELKAIKGEKGDPGKDGYTPIKGVDYGTPEEIAEIAQSAADILQPDINRLKEDIADLKYVPIKVASFSVNPNAAEIGSTVSEVMLSWDVNKTPSTLTLDGAVLDNSAASTRVDELELTANKTWTLRAVDERGAEATAKSALSFLNGVYYGVWVVPDSIDSSFILGLTKTLRGSKMGSFTVNAGDGQYIWYCVPSRFGSCSFKVGGFDGGFDRVAVIDFTNASGYTERYDVYRSANAGLGNTKVGVT